jgi:hypothetical protein
MLVSATALVSVMSLFVVAPQGANAYRSVKIRQMASSKHAVSSFGNSSGAVDLPVYRHAIRRQSPLKRQPGFSAPLLLKMQYSEDDVPIEADDEFEKPGPADSYSEPSLESSSKQALEYVVKQNPYVEMISEAEVESLQMNPRLVVVWKQFVKCVNDIEEEMGQFRYIRSSFLAFIKSVQAAHTSKDNDQMKMLSAKAGFIMEELEAYEETAMLIVFELDALSSKLQQAEAHADGDRQVIEALYSCSKAKDAAWNDFEAAWDKTQERMHVLLDLLGENSGNA